MPVIHHDEAILHFAFNMALFFAVMKKNLLFEKFMNPRDGKIAFPRNTTSAQKRFKAIERVGQSQLVCLEAMFGRHINLLSQSCDETWMFNKSHINLIDTNRKVNHK